MALKTDGSLASWGWNDSGQLAAVHAQMGSQVRKSFPRFGNLQVVKLPPGASVDEMVDEYQRSGLVEYAEPDYFITIASENHPNDPYYSDGSLWNTNNTNDADIDAPEGWYFRASAEGVIVAVIDSGVRPGWATLCLALSGAACIMLPC